MQLVVKYGATAYGGPHDLVVAHYGDDATVDIGQFPGCALIPFSGALEDLERVGPDPRAVEPGEEGDTRPLDANATAPDTRPMLAPDVDLVAYAASVRYTRERAQVSVTIGGAQAPLATAPDFRNGYRDTLLAIITQLRKDGATFKFADGVSRAATNAEMQTAIGAVFAYVQALFDVESTVQADQRKSKPTMKTMAAVDAAFAAVKA